MNKNNLQDIEKYFGSMSKKVGTMEEVDAYIREDRITRKECDSYYLTSTAEEYSKMLKDRWEEKDADLKINRETDIKDDLKGKHVYIDSGIFIYLLGGFKTSESLNNLKAMILKDEIKASTSLYALAEVAPYLARNDDPKKTEVLYNNVTNFLKPFILEKDCLNESDEERFRRMYDERAFLKDNHLEHLAARYLMSTQHIVSAVQNGCDIFLTNDLDVRVVPDGMELMLFQGFEATDEMDQKLTI